MDVLSFITIPDLFTCDRNRHTETTNRFILFITVCTLRVVQTPTETIQTKPRRPNVEVYFKTSTKQILYNKIKYH